MALSGRNCSLKRKTVEQAQPDTQYEQWRGGIAKGKLLVAVLERFTGRAG
jgi:hypothetical protein